MTVGNSSDGSISEKSELFYVRLQNLPATATHKHIREFFSDLTIPEGGISIHQNCSFVIFDNVKDAATALSKDKEYLDGKKVRISQAILKDVRRTRVNEVRRKLVFGPPEEVTVVKQKKRIRPTKVKDCSTLVPSKRFCPEEIEFPAKSPVISVMNAEGGVIEFSEKKPSGNGLESHDEVYQEESKPIVSVENLLEDELKYPDKFHKNGENTLVPNKKCDINEDDVPDYPEKNSGIKESSQKMVPHLEENGFVKEGPRMFLEEKVMTNQKEIYLMDENVTKAKLERKIPGQGTSLVSTKKMVRDVTNKFPTKKTIKPTSVLTMNLFKMSYEGTVF